MAGTPKGWEKDSDKLYIHESGVRVQRMVYKGKDGWYLVPLDLDLPCVEFEATNEGRDKAFEQFEKGLPAAPKPRKSKAKAAAPAEEEAEEKDDDDGEESEEADEGDDD
jgi:hypothetical protein